MTGQQLLLKDKPLAEWWAGVKADPRFEVVLGHVKAELFETNPNATALQSLAMLSTITDNQGSGSLFPPTGLSHEAPKRKI